MMKNAFVDANGVLTSWGYAESNNADQLIPVSDDFALEVGKWKYANDQWIAFTQENK
ncbi:hypothetical protein [Paraburkholderia azotifigens]|uniref:hypothetical protein n=1 Tax=Paraburkholderia azotifigens TaxID=2057004 RepID=UPI0038BD1337